MSKTEYFKQIESSAATLEDERKLKTEFEKTTKVLVTEFLQWYTKVKLDFRNTYPHCTPELRDLIERIEGKAFTEIWEVYISEMEKEVKQAI